MPLTQQNYLDLIAWEISDSLPSGPAQDPVRTQLTAALKAQLPLLWQLASVEALAFPASNWRDVLQYAYTKRKAIQVMLGQLSASVDAMLGRVFRLQANQKFRSLLLLLQELNKQIVGWEANARAAEANPFAVGQILQTAPVMPGPVQNIPTVDPTQPLPSPGVGKFGDPNWPGYGGSPVEGGAQQGDPLNGAW